MKKNLPATPSLKSTQITSEQQALAQFAAGRYKEAGDLYKNLLKTHNQAQWRQQLAQCYLLRAQAMAGKGMLKEAIVLWENYAEQAPKPWQSQDHYLAWLLATKNTVKLKTGLARLSAADLDAQNPELAVLLGWLILTTQPELQALLPQDSAFIAHLGCVREALAAYRENQADNQLNNVDAALKKLPFRSAFRDFRALLKAAALIPIAPEQTRELLLKIPAGSPYHPTAQALLTYLSDGELFVGRIFQHNHLQRKIISQAKGFSKQQIELLDIVGKQNTRLNDKLKFNLANQYQALFGDGLAQAFCYATLAAYPAGLKDYGKRFGELSAFDENRLKALQAERNNEGDDADYYWYQCLTILKRHDTENADKIALIQRHLAKINPQEAIALLTDSLTHDPADRDSYLQILKYYSQDEADPIEHKQWLEKSLKQFPQDVEFLTLAIKAATRNKAYKKAVQYAKSLLKVDPVNTLAKQALFDSHLAHARRLLKSKNFALVDKEIHAAEQVNPTKRWQAQAQLLRGFFQYLSEDKKQGLAAVTQAAQKRHADPVNACFQITMEAMLLDLPVATFLKGLPPIKDYLLSAAELTALIALIKHYHEQDIDTKTLYKALEKIKAVIKKSVQQQYYGEAELLALCQTLDVIGHFELLRHCAKWAQWQKPIWAYYRIYAEANGDPSKINYRGNLSLQMNLEQARKENDQQTALLLGKLIERYHRNHSPAAFGGFLDDAFGMDEDDDFQNTMEDLFGHLSDPVLKKLYATVEELSRQTTPERLLKDLVKFLPKNANPTEIMSLFMEPDFFTALLILKAAEKLGIQTGVSGKDVLDYFSGFDDAPKPIFPFF